MAENAPTPMPIQVSTTRTRPRRVSTSTSETCTAPGVEVGHLLKRRRETVEASRQDAELIAEFYKPDYERFGYAPPDASGLRSDPFAGLRWLIARPIARAIVAKQRYDWIR